MIITITDLRLAGHCPRGVKQWFETQGLDFRAFLKDGIDSTVLTASGCGMAVEAVERTVARHGAEDGEE